MSKWVRGSRYMMSMPTMDEAYAAAVAKAGPNQAALDVICRVSDSKHYKPSSGPQPGVVELADFYRMLLKVSDTGQWPTT